VPLPDRRENATATRLLLSVIRPLQNLSALWQLFRLAAISGFRLKGPYWTWRMHTAFGRGMPSSRAELIRSVLEYGRWIARMRRL